MLPCKSLHLHHRLSLKSLKIILLITRMLINDKHILNIPSSLFPTTAFPHSNNKPQIKLSDNTHSCKVVFGDCQRETFFCFFGGDGVFFAGDGAVGGLLGVLMVEGGLGSADGGEGEVGSGGGEIVDKVLLAGFEEAAVGFSGRGV